MKSDVIVISWAMFTLQNIYWRREYQKSVEMKMVKVISEIDTEEMENRSHVTLYTELM